MNIVGISEEFVKLVAITCISFFVVVGYVEFLRYSAKQKIGVNE